MSTHQNTLGTDCDMRYDDRTNRDPPRKTCYMAGNRNVLGCGRSDHSAPMRSRIPAFSCMINTTNFLRTPEIKYLFAPFAPMMYLIMVAV